MEMDSTVAVCILGINPSEKQQPSSRISFYWRAVNHLLVVVKTPLVRLVKADVLLKLLAGVATCWLKLVVVSGFPLASNVFSTPTIPPTARVTWLVVFASIDVELLLSLAF